VEEINIIYDGLFYDLLSDVYQISATILDYLDSCKKVWFIVAKWHDFLLFGVGKSLDHVGH